MSFLSALSTLPCWQAPLWYSPTLVSTSELALPQCSLMVMQRLAGLPWPWGPLQFPEASGLALTLNIPALLL